MLWICFLSIKKRAYIDTLVKGLKYINGIIGLFYSISII